MIFESRPPRHKGKRVPSGARFICRSRVPIQGMIFESRPPRCYTLAGCVTARPPSLLAGKLHVILQRSYLKGRDLYDLIWYLSDKDWPDPNLMLLNNALKQTKWEGPAITLENWRESVRSQVETTVFAQALDDVRPFLASAEELGLITKDNLLRLLTAS